MQKIIVIVGPTAVGKTALSIQLAKQLNGEIISGDSMQVYRQLTIGTAKITPAERENIPHHLIDCREMTENYSVADFQKEAHQAIKTIADQGKCPIIVGGTGLYIQALLYNYRLDGQEQNQQLRSYYENYAERYGRNKLWALLQTKDPAMAQTIHPNNQKKVVRSLERLATTTMKDVAPDKTPKKCYDYYLIGLTMERPLLYQRINQRVDQMMTQGLLEEARTLYNCATAQAAQGIGYKEFFPYFAGQCTLETAIEQVKQNSRRYAKRQLTWFKNRMDTNWWENIQQPEQSQLLQKKLVQWQTQEDK